MLMSFDELLKFVSDDDALVACPHCGELLNAYELHRDSGRDDKIRFDCYECETALALRIMTITHYAVELDAQEDTPHA